MDFRHLALVFLLDSGEKETACPRVQARAAYILPSTGGAGGQPPPLDSRSE